MIHSFSGRAIFSLIILGLLWRLYSMNPSITSYITNTSMGTGDQDSVQDSQQKTIKNPNRFDYLSSNGYTTASDTQDFAGATAINRAQAAVFLKRYGDLSDLAKDTETSCDFPDINALIPAMQETIKRVCSYGLLRGSQGNFLPERIMTKDELLTTLVRTKTGYLDEAGDPWFDQYFARATEHGLVDPETDISNFSGPVTKEHLGKRLYQLSLLEQ